MDKLKIIGGRPLEGTVQVSGAKNAALPILCATLLSERPLRLTGVPRLMDISTMAKLLGQMGVQVERSADGMVLDSKKISDPTAPYEMVKTMRASVLVLGPLLARCGRAKVSLPGGCAIGQRPVDQHVKGLQAMGATINVEHGYMHAEAERLRGTRIVMDLVTVTGTESLMMAAALAEGTTVIENAAREPEVVDLAALLTAMGARLQGVGTGRIEIEGVKDLGGATHRVVADRIEAGTLLVAAAITRGDVVVTDMVPDHLSSVLAKLEECGASLEVGPTSVRVRAQGRPRAADITTSPYPGFP